MNFRFDLIVIQLCSSVFSQPDGSFGFVGIWIKLMKKTNKQIFILFSFPIFNKLGNC